VTATHAFVGLRRCGGAMFMAVDELRTTDLDPPFGYDDVVDLLRTGGRLERVPLEVARKTRLCFGCEACK
jgi:hypothetical protein